MIHHIKFCQQAGAASRLHLRKRRNQKALKAITGLSKITDNLNISEQARTAMIFNAVSASAGAKIRVDSRLMTLQRKRRELKKNHIMKTKAAENILTAAGTGSKAARRQKNRTRASPQDLPAAKAT